MLKWITQYPFCVAGAVCILICLIQRFSKHPTLLLYILANATIVICILTGLIIGGALAGLILTYTGLKAYLI